MAAASFRSLRAICRTDRCAGRDNGADRADLAAQSASGTEGSVDSDISVRHDQRRTPKLPDAFFTADTFSGIDFHLSVRFGDGDAGRFEDNGLDARFACYASDAGGGCRKIQFL